MSLTILVHRERPEVGIVRWFLDPKISISYPTGPLIQIPLEEFRATGWDWVRRHFQEYAKLRLPEEKATPVFAPGEEKKFLMKRHAIRIRIEDSGEELTLIPQTFRKYALSGLESMGREVRRAVPINSPLEAFLKCFNEAIAAAAGKM
jgi:hypothetical protein